MYEIKSSSDYDDLFEEPFRAKKILYSLDFLSVSNDILKSGSKKLCVDFDPEENYRSLPEFPCGEMGCRATFTTVHDYEVHCRSVHSLVCSECKKVFPNYAMLDIHIEEKHDSYHLAAVAKNMARFSCLVEGCKLTYSSAKLRDTHLVCDHNFPSNFKYRPLPNSSSEDKDMCMDVDHPVEVSKPRQRVPRVICFGQGSTRAFKKASRGRTNKDISMKELADAL